MRHSIAGSLWRSLLLATLPLCAPALAAPSEVTLASFVGDWHSNDPALGAPATTTLSWQPALGGKFFEVRYAIRRAGSSSGTAVFQGTAFYQRGTAPEITAFWADSSGDLLPIRAKIDGTALVATWGSEGGKLGRTRYALTSSDHLQVTDWQRNAAGEWVEFNQLEFRRTEGAGPSEAGDTPPLVSGIGGFFFRGDDPDTLARWYDDTFEIPPVPTDYDHHPWYQEGGFTVFAPFPEGTEYFGDPEQQWMINLRVARLDDLVTRLRARGIAVDVDPATYPNGRFARLTDPEGNPIQLWQPSDPAPP